jgi:N-methylhydantoinase B
VGKKTVRLDPILLEILNRKVAAAADEMAVTLQRTSRSTYVKEAADYGTGIADLKGNIFGYPARNSVNHINRFCGPSIRAIPDLEPGDVIVTNDPYLSGGLATHLPDLHMIKPYFHGRRVVCYGWCFIHFSDMGGRVPSSISPSNHEIFQEGLRVPPMKLVRKGVLNEDFVKVFTANCRTPDANMGDVMAMLGALHTGSERVADIVDRHGVETFLACQKALQDYTADKTRAVLRRIPEGTYAFWDYMDDDLVTRIPLRFRLAMTVADGTVHFDLSGTDPQVAAAYNVPTLGIAHPWLFMRLISFILTHDNSMALNAGIYRHITVTNPAGTVMNAEFPDAVGIRHTAARRLSDAMSGTILKASPDIMAAPSCGSSVPFVVAEQGPEGGRPAVQVIEPLRGGMGAMKGRDGADNRENTMNNMNNHPVETVESDACVVIRAYDIHADSGGPGRWRGGVGQRITTEVLRDGCTVLARGMERLRFPAWGVAGGKPGRPFRAILNEGRTGEAALSKIDQLKVRAGDTVTFLMPGGAGFGDPYLRAPESVRTDVELGFVSREAAATDYGVVIADNGEIEDEATKRLRSSRVRDNIRADFDFGPEREAWEAVFDDKTMEALNAGLYGLPKSVRQEKRRWIVSQAVPDLPVAGTRSLAETMADADAIRTRLVKAMETVFGDERVTN